MLSAVIVSWLLIYWHSFQGYCEYNRLQPPFYYYLSDPRGTFSSSFLFSFSLFPPLSTNMLFACLFPSISYCVPRHTVVEFCECSPTFWKFWQLGTDCPFIFPGGRTAWTARVLVNWKLYQARFFYDGDRNAREDAAEVALYHLAPKTHAAVSQSYLTGRLFPYEYDLHEGQWPMTQELKRYEKHYY